MRGKIPLFRPSREFRRQVRALPEDLRREFESVMRELQEHLADLPPEVDRLCGYRSLSIPSRTSDHLLECRVRKDRILGEEVTVIELLKIRRKRSFHQVEEFFRGHPEILKALWEFFRRFLPPSS